MAVVIIVKDFTAKEQIFLLEKMIGNCGYFWIGLPYTNMIK